jgi:hypothetical protein
LAVTAVEDGIRADSGGRGQKRTAVRTRVTAIAVRMARETSLIARFASRRRAKAPRRFELLPLTLAVAVAFMA